MKNLSLKDFLIVILIIILLVSIGKCTHQKKINRSNLESLIDTTSFFKNKLGTETASRKMLELTNKQLKNQVFKKDSVINVMQKEFSKVNTVVKVVTETKIDSIGIPFAVKVPIDFNRFGTYPDKWFSFDWKVNQDGLSLTNVNTPTELGVVTGIKKKWFLGRESVTTDVAFTNPYINTVEVKTYTVRLNKPFYDTRVFNIGIGFLGGVLLKK